jgi:hypothetical protein
MVHLHTQVLDPLKVESLPTRGMSAGLGRSVGIAMRP